MDHDEFGHFDNPCLKKRLEKSMPSGRIRYTTPKSDDEVRRLGEHLVKWATEKTPEDEPLRARFCEWYTLDEIGMLRNEWEALIKLSVFRVYYEKAQAALGRRFIDGTINPSIGHRLMWHYVPESKEQELEKMRYEAEFKKAANDSQQQQKVVFEVNYKNDSNNSVQILSETVSDSPPTSS